MHSSLEHRVADSPVAGNSPDRSGAAAFAQEHFAHSTIARPSLLSISPGSIVHAEKSFPDYALGAEIKELGLQVLKQGIKVIIEQPHTWLNAEQGGDATRLMFGNLLVAMSQLQIPFHAIPTTKKDSLTPREMSPNELRFTYHTALTTGHPNLWQIKESYFPPFFTFDRKGYSGWAELATNKDLFNRSQEIDADFALAYAKDLRDWIQANRTTKYIQSTSAAPEREGYVLHPIQVPKDPVVLNHAHIPHRKLLLAAIAQAEQLNVPLVLKQHPRCNDKTVANIIQTSRSANVIVSDAPILDLIAGAKSVLVINSGTGMEALIQGKPVYSAGASDYRWAANEVTAVDQLEEAFVAPQHKLSEVERAKFLTYYFRDYCVHGAQPSSFERHLTEALTDWLTSQTNPLASTSQTPTLRKSWFPFSWRKP